MEIILQKVGTPESASGGLAGEMSTKVIKLRGIPYNVAPIEIAEFFRGIKKFSSFWLMNFFIKSMTNYFMRSSAT